MNYLEIVKVNEALIKKIINYMKLIRDVDLVYIGNNTNFMLKELLCYMRKEKLDIAQMRKHRDQLQEDLFYLERNGGVSSQSFDGVSGGHDNGQRKNGVETMLLQIQQMRKDITESTVEILLVEKTKSEKQQLVRDFLYILPQVQYARVVEATYFDLMSDDEIAAELYYEYESIRKFRKRAINYLSQIIRTYIERA